MGSAVYAAAAEQGESGDVPGGEATEGAAQGESSDDDVVDAEVVDDDEETK